MFEFVVDKLPDINKPLSAKYIKSFAYITFKERIPNILTGIINDLKTNIENDENVNKTDVNEVINKISNLINCMQSDQPLVPLTLNGTYLNEVNVYNKLIKEKEKENNGKLPSWFQTNWLFAECYLYFKLYEIFHFSESLQKYDPFRSAKINTILASENAIILLANWFTKLKCKKSLDEQEIKEKCILLLKYSLWGNKADLSLSCGKAVAADEDIFTNIDESDTYILVNDVEAAYKILSQNHENSVVDIVLDNAGYELFNDLCLADFLVWSGLVKKVIFHGKAIPWFVSDVTMEDFNTVFELLNNKIKSDSVVTLSENWKNYVKNGQWEIKCEPFWILPYDYSKMQTEATNLYKDLSKNVMVIFKGDLNYRKLMNDTYWEPTTTFKTALRGFAPTNVLALRTIKADTVSGLKKGVFEQLSNQEPNWLITGKYALIQLLQR